MTARYRNILFTPGVLSVQAERGTKHLYDGKADAPPGTDTLRDEERDFIAARDSFYMASVSETGWPYVQHRGGPKGFLKAVDDATLAFSDFRGNGQYLSAANFGADARVSLFLMDYAGRARLKIIGHADLLTAQAEPDLARRVALPGYKAVMERIIRIRITAYDWNCSQHITPRFTAEEVQEAARDLGQRLAALEARNAQLEAEIAALKGTP